MQLDLPKGMDKKTRKLLEDYHKKIKKADVFVTNSKDARGIPIIRISFETYDKRNKGSLEVINIYG